MPVATRHIRFGPFELDPHSGELHKSGQKLKISGKPVQILTILLNQPGELISREELRAQLWPADTFVDFENGLNTAVKKLRQALGDEADAPRYVETLPRRGYRFIGQIVSTEVQARVEAANSRAQNLSIPGPESAPRPDNEVVDDRSNERGKHRWWRLGGVRIGATALVVAVGLSVAINVGGVRDRLLRLITPPIHPRDPIVLADFVNTTDDPVFDDALKQGLFVQLSQSPFLNILPDYHVRTILKQMGHNPDDRLTPELAWEVCQRTTSKAMLGGSIAKLGNQYVVGLNALDCATGESLAQAQTQAVRKEEVLNALGRGAADLRRRLGESLASVQKFDTPILEATTPSLEALKVYSLGRKAHYSKGDTAALPFFKRAVELDPNFAMPYAAMSTAYGNLNEFGRAAENARKAYELRAKVSEREKFFIEANYYGTATGELEKVAQPYELWRQIYPSDDVPYIGLGFLSGQLGNWERALEESRRALRLQPNKAFNYLNLGVVYTALNRLDEAEAVFKQAEERKLENEGLRQSRYSLAFLKGDAKQMTQLVSDAMGTPGEEEGLLAAQADTEGWYGRLKTARALTRRAMHSAQRNDAKETAAAYQAAAALREVESGNREQARADANAALKLAPNRDVRVVAALTLARAGDPAAAEKLAASLDRTFPLDTLVRRYWLPTIRAGVALERKDPNRAIELLTVASPVELGQPTQSTIFLCPVYLRGEAYLMLHDGNGAEAEFQKFIDHRGLVVNFPWGALARLGLARAYVMQGNTAKARAAYVDFLALWKDADPDIPILREARAEYDTLK